MPDKIRIARKLATSDGAFNGNGSAGDGGKSIQYLSCKTNYERKSCQNWLTHWFGDWAGRRSIPGGGAKIPRRDARRP
jgi:hypothetical protein